MDIMSSTSGDSGDSAGTETKKPAKTNLVALRDEREKAIELISERFSEDIIDGDEMERRLELVHAATTLEDLAEVTDDLRSPKKKAEPETALVPARRGPNALARSDEVADETRTVTILGEARRDGRWVPARRTRVLNVLGETTLDFREARLGPGVTTVQVKVVLGNLKVIVPPGLDVAIECPAILSSIKRDESIGSFEPAAADDPSLRVQGSVILGELRIEERLPGESPREARKRRKRERKELAGKQRQRRLGDGR